MRRAASAQRAENADISMSFSDILTEALAQQRENTDFSMRSTTRECRFKRKANDERRQISARVQRSGNADSSVSSTTRKCRFQSELSEEGMQIGIWLVSAFPRRCAQPGSFISSSLSSHWNLHPLIAELALNSAFSRR